jgi:AraC-like DNA-binding protein
MDIVHTVRHASHHETDEFFLCRQMSGGLALEQNGAGRDLNTGDFTLIDPRLPYRGKFTGASKLLLVKLPRRHLEARVGTAHLTPLLGFPADVGVNGLLSGFLGLLSSHAGQLSHTAQQIIQSQLLDLLAISIATLIGCPPKGSTTKSLLSMRLHAAVETRLDDSALTPKTVATTAGVSVRYANAILSRQDLSLSRLILARRLERCRAAFEDPSQADRTVSEIAYSWGFADMTHFGRAFRSRFGVLPSGYRAAIKANRGT